MAEETREAWLMAAVEHMRPWYEPHGKAIPEHVLVSVGYAKKPGKGIGWCYPPAATQDEATTIFVSPELVAEDPVKLLGVLVHELIHAADKGESGHKGWFASTAKSLGLTGKMTATTVGNALEEKLSALAVELGPLPHKALSPTIGGGGKVGAQKNRQIKIECVECGYKLRGSKTVLDLGIPDCPVDGGQMLREDAA
jgi:hypothetical protein